MFLNFLCLIAELGFCGNSVFATKPDLALSTNSFLVFVKSDFRNHQKTQKLLNIYSGTLHSINVPNSTKTLSAIRFGNIKLLSLGILLISVLLGSSAVNAYQNAPQTNNTIHSITVVITHASYTDLDNDGNEDDVVVISDFYLQNDDFYEFIYFITLILPSGMYYQYLVRVWAWVDYVSITNSFYNHATESGNYTVIIEAWLLNPDVYYDISAVIFDPPGGSDGGKPTFGAT